MKDRLLNCIKNKNTNYFPIWFMRQAGRYLPEFREIRKKNPNFIELCLNRNLVPEITLQPIKRFNLLSFNSISCFSKKLLDSLIYFLNFYLVFFYIFFH